jgi:hypothetical protein
MSSPFYTNVSRLLSVKPSLIIECIGNGLKNNKCRRRISANIRTAAVRTFYLLERLESTNELRNRLESIAGNLLCQQHVHQREILLQQWWQAPHDLLAAKCPTPESIIPGAFPEDDENLMAAILELSRVDKMVQWREEAANAKAERMKEEKSKKLRNLRICWHPDRFVSRPSWQLKAKILFQMIPADSWC